MLTEHNRRVVERFDALVGVTDLDPLEDLCTPDLVNHQPGEYSRDVAFIYRLREGRIAERWAVRDDLTMLRQLGAIGSSGR